MTYSQGLAQFFDASKLPIPQNAYVAWIDVMGIRANLSKSLPLSANFVFKLHSAVLASPHTGIDLYPVMDGAFAVGQDKDAVLQFLKDVMTRLAATFVHANEDRHRFLVKGALAYGPVVHGNKISTQASVVVGKHPQYRDAVLIGMPMVQAYQSESRAPPFGIYVHESARAFAPPGKSPLAFRWWPWWDPGADAHDLATKVAAFFDWAQAHSGDIGYRLDRIAEHRRMAAEYFADV